LSELEFKAFLEDFVEDHFSDYDVAELPKKDELGFLGSYSSFSNTKTEFGSLIDLKKPLSLLFLFALLLFYSFTLLLVFFVFCSFHRSQRERKE